MLDTFVFGVFFSHLVVADGGHIQSYIGMLVPEKDAGFGVFFHLVVADGGEVAEDEV